MLSVLFTCSCVFGCTPWLPVTTCLASSCLKLHGFEPQTEILPTPGEFEKIHKAYNGHAFKSAMYNHAVINGTPTRLQARASLPCRHRVHCLHLTAHAYLGAARVIPVAVYAACMLFLGYKGEYNRVCWGISVNPSTTLPVQPLTILVNTHTPVYPQCSRSQSSV